MAVFSVELPDKRVLDIEAADQDTAIRGAQEWHAGNPQTPPQNPQAPQAPLGRVEQHDFGDAYRGANGELTAINPATDVVHDGVVYARGATPDTRTTTPLTQGMRGVARSIRGDSREDNVLAGGIATAANWLDWTPDVVEFDALAPLGAAAVGTMGLGFLGRPDNMVGVFGGRLQGPRAAHAPSAEAGAAPAAAVPRDREAALQMIADTLTRAGKTPEEMRTILANMDDARHFHSSGVAQDAVALGDLDESLTRLAGSIARQSPEAARDIREFIHARQTGHTPRNLEPIDMADRGLPSREAYTDPITGAQAQRRLSRDFDTADKNYVPMGLMERMRDALRRAFLISDADYHGHGLTGVRTEERILGTARKAANANYDAAYQAGMGVNLRDALTSVFDKYLAQAATSESLKVENLIKSVRTQFRSGAIELKQFDRIKRELDDRIKGFINRPDKSGVHSGGVLNDLKNDLLAAVDSVVPAYRTARDAYSSDMDMLKALKAGRDALRENSELTADAFNALKTDGERKLFRLGLLDSVTARGQDKSRAHDFTQVFKTPRVEEILTATIPRSQKGGAEFADRPRRFGRYVDSQSQMIEARNTVQGGSSSLRNAADDAATDLLQTIALKEVTSFLNMFRSSQSTWHFGQQILTNAIDKAFGVRADVAKNLAEMLFTADAKQRAAILDSVAQRMPRSRMERFNQIMTEYTQAMERGGGPAALRSTLNEEQQQSSSPRDPKNDK